ncbi:MAG: 1,4-alpha-glucan branching protein GlgB [Rhodospirillales bacterium]|nr:1,4-alpha-glucan branching protein GlgB [Rhodospirillales bacterium]
MPGAGSAGGRRRRGIILRAFLPDATRALLRIPGNPAEQEMLCVDPAGLFEIRLAELRPETMPAYDYLVEWDDAPLVSVADPYRFAPSGFTDDDDALFAAGRHARLFEKLGARPAMRDAASGVDFGVWAPNAARVSVVGPFNAWDGRRHTMQRTGSRGVWQLFVPGARTGDFYKFEIKTSEDDVFLKADPFAVATEPPPHRASIVADVAARSWRDNAWMETGRAARTQDRGLRTYRSAPDTTPEAAAASADAAGCGFIELAADAAASGHRGCSRRRRASHRPRRCWPGSMLAMCRASASCCRRRTISFPDAAADLAWFDGTRLYERPDSVDGEPLRFDLAKGEVRSVLLSVAAFRLWCWHADALVCDIDRLRRLADLPAEFLATARLIFRDTAWTTRLSSANIRRIADGRHDDPFAILGLHVAPSPPAVGTAPVEGPDPVVVRTMQPDAVGVHRLPGEAPYLAVEMTAIDPAGLFEARLPVAPADWRLRVFTADGGSKEIVDPYTLTDFTFGAQDRHLFAEGNHYRLYRKLGAHPRTVRGIEGVTFAVWAPNAEGVGVVGAFNGWNGLVHQMKRHSASGVWEIFVPGAAEGDVYKFEIRARNGHVFLKTDPFASRAEVPPATGSVVHNLDGVHDWRDAGWLEARRNGKPWEQPIAIYEVHLGSWMQGPGGRRLSYSEVAAKLVPYVKTLGFTHIELLPIAEHPYEPSWGYQVSHFYAPTSRFGPPEELMEFIDLCHENGIGVILDWVPGHFPKDAHALAWFDGTHLFEHADPRRGEHPDWGTLIFNYGRHEVENFLIANALFWLEVYHFDGLRVDAVASILYLDYSRPAHSGWIPNAYGGKENLEAIEFLKHTNSILHARFPGILMIAEESTSWPNVSRPTDQGGLGFGFKWNMGWMHDALAYFSVPPAERKWHHGKLTFSIVYAFNENFVLSLSHDEVVHLKRSLLGKMPGEDWERFANLRLLFTLMYAHPGKKLLFMGGELGQESEWSHETGLEWRALEKKPNRALGWYIQDLNRLYRTQPALHQVDFRAQGFEWLEVENAEESILAFLRKAKDPRRALLFAANFSAVSRPEHRIGVPYPVTFTLLFDSNDAKYGGSGAARNRDGIAAEEVPWHGHAFSISVSLPALSAVILQPEPPSD